MHRLSAPSGLNRIRTGSGKLKYRAIAAGLGSAMLAAALAAGPPASASTGAGPVSRASASSLPPEAPTQLAGRGSAASGTQGSSYTAEYLTGVSTLSASNTWAVGWYEPISGTQACAAPTSSGNGQCTLAEHWSGKTWQRVPSPNPAGSEDAQFEAVKAISATDVWAVGYYFCPDGNCTTLTLTEHWNGKTWKIVHSPNPATGCTLNGIAAVSANDIWAVGSCGEGLIEHWNGKTWKIVKYAGSDVELHGLTAVSATDIWAVGYGNTGTVVEQWNGRKWSSVTSPSPVPDHSSLYAVDAISSKDIWAVGQDGTPPHITPGPSSGSKGEHTLIEQWNGTKWQQVSSPNPTGIQEINGLISLDAVSADNVWAVGLYGSIYTSVSTLVEHWNGKSWSIVASPNAKGYVSSAFQGVSGSSASTIWAVGVTYNGSNYGLLYEKWNGHKWVINSAS